MKKLKLDVGKLQLKKEKISSLSNEQMGKVYGGQPVTTATVQTCCAPSSVLACQQPTFAGCQPTPACITTDPICALSEGIFCTE